MSERWRIGVDLGGTKIEAIALDIDGTEHDRVRVATPRGDYDGTVRTIRDVVLELERRLGITASVGVGMPGAMSPKTGLVKNSNSTWAIGKPLEQDLTAALERPVRTANDANCFAVSEAVDGAGAGAAMVFGVIIGTGVGGGIAISGQAWTGQHAIAGEWGHNPLPWPDATEFPGPSCYCGRRGCIESWLSGPGFAADFERRTGETLGAPDIVAGIETDARCSAAWQAYVSRLARALGALINILDPDVIVLGGGMSNVARLYADLPPVLSGYVFSESCDTPVRQALHGDSSGVRGAAWLWQ